MLHSVRLGSVAKLVACELSNTIFKECIWYTMLREDGHGDL